MKRKIKRKDYLVEELSNQEKDYLVKIATSVRNKYIKRNYKYINNTKIGVDESIIENEESVIGVVLEKCLKELESAKEFEKTLLNPELYKYVKALSLKEKEVLFYLYWQKKEINEVAEILNVYRGTVRRIRDNALNKIATKLLNGGDGNV